MNLYANRSVSDYFFQRIVAVIPPLFDVFGKSQQSISE